MDKTLKFIGSGILLLLFTAHVVLLVFFVTPTHKLASILLPDDSGVIRSEMIPEEVKGFIEKQGIKFDDIGTYQSEAVNKRMVASILSFRESKFMSSDERLALKLNLLYFGADIFGINSASQYYYNKNAPELSNNEWITLLGLQRIFSQ